MSICCCPIFSRVCDACVGAGLTTHACPIYPSGIAPAKPVVIIVSNREGKFESLACISICSDFFPGTEHAAKGEVLRVCMSIHIYATLICLMLPRPIEATLEVELPPGDELAKQEEPQPADTEILLNDAGRPLNAVPSARGAVDSAKGHLNTQPSLCQQVGHMPLEYP